MPKKENKRGLGKGLGALIPEAAEDFILDNAPAAGEVAPGGVNLIDIAKINPGGEQARKNFPEETIEELAESIRRHGVIQPLVAREHGAGAYELIAGERRWRAAKAAGLTEVPVVIIEADDKKVAELGLIENLQREDLSPIDEAMAFRRMLDEYRYSQESLGEAVGKSRSYIANSLRLLTLSPAETAALVKGEITPGHARAILSVKTPDGRSFLLDEIVAKSLSVRQAEDLAKRINSVDTEKPTPKEKRRSATDLTPFQREMENKLRQRFGTKVKIKNTPYGGSIEIDYYSEEDLNRILSLVIEEEESLKRD